MPDGDVLAAASQALEDRIPDLAARLRRTLRNDVPAYSADTDPALAALESNRIDAALRSFVESIRGAEEPGDNMLDAAILEARAAAQAGIELDALIQTYRVLQADMWDEVLASTSGGHWGASVQLAVQKYLSGLHFRWCDAVVDRVVDAYQTEQRNFFYQSRDRRLRTSLREVLAGNTDVLAHCQYPLEAFHTAAVIWGDQRRDTVNRLATLVDAAAVLSVDNSTSTTLAWFSLTTSEAPIDAIEPADGAFVAIGNPSAGAQGFRSSHFQAWRAYRVGRLTGRKVACYRDVALESLFLQNEEAARDLVTHQLGPLDLADPRTEVLCQTIRTYFACGCNAARTAAQLQVHERTVAYRLRTVEDRLGVDVVHRRDELVTALRLLDALRAGSTLTSPTAMTRI